MPVEVGIKLNLAWNIFCYTIPCTWMNEWMPGLCVSQGLSWERAQEGHIIEHVSGSEVRTNWHQPCRNQACRLHPILTVYPPVHFPQLKATTKHNSTFQFILKKNRRQRETDLQCNSESSLLLAFFSFLFSPFPFSIFHQTVNFVWKPANLWQVQ